MRVMQITLGETRKQANRPGKPLACRRRLPHSPAPMLENLTPPTARSGDRRWPWPRGLAGLALLCCAAASLAQEPELNASGAAIATGNGLLVTEIVVEKLEPAAAPARPAARFVPAGRLEAGDEVHYTIRVRNPGDRPVGDARVTKRLPFGLRYVPGSATGPACDIEYSEDGGETFVAKPPDGEFTHLRWILRRPLPPGSTALLRFRATFP